ncbi:MAG: adenylate cyclase [Pseudorhodobacter sp.]|jgi:adenylate cyclase
MRVWRRSIAILAACVVLILAGFLASPNATLRGWQARLFDAVMISIMPAPRPALPVLVVDIGATDDAGQPWDRTATARLVEKLAAASPKVIAFDMVFSGGCAAGGVTNALALAFAKSPVVLGFLLSDRATLPPSPAPAVAVKTLAARSIWSAAGAEAACPIFAQGAAGAGAVSLLGQADGKVRNVPALVAVAAIPYPSLAVEAVRVAQGWGAPVLTARNGGIWLRIGQAMLMADAEAQLRFQPSRPNEWPKTTLDAAQILALDPAEWQNRVAGAVVFVGSSLPQSGGLRATATSPLHPSVQIQADLARGLLAGAVPHRAAAAPRWEAGFALVAGITAIWLTFALPVLPGLGLSVALASIWGFAAIAHARQSLHLSDPLLPALVVLAAATLALIGKAWASGRAEAQLRRRIGQLLPPSVVTRLADDPSLFRLKGEAREVTALTSDIEGFSQTTRKLGPEALVQVLDAYFTLTCAIVLRHGGMIDKIVGDSIHALFNAPLDLPGHVDAALACAAEIAQETEAFRLLPQMQAAGLGRTRIGIETGPAILGDVGSGAKIDYTAHGDAVNLASRLEALNKDLGTSICIGPGAAAQASVALRALGEYEVRSFGRLALFTLVDAS